MSTIPFLTLVISVAAVLGILLGEIRYRGIGLGIGGVLFSGILVGHFSHEWFGLTIRTAEGATEAGSILGYVQEFGWILFVYAIGVQVGPSFFSSLRSMGAKLVGWVLLIIVMGCSIAMSLHFMGIVKIDAMVGMYSGAITNTPALGAANQMIMDMRQVLDPAVADELGFDSFVVPSAYAMAYPFGVCGILLTMILLRIIFRVNIEAAGQAYLESKTQGQAKINTLNIIIHNQEYLGKPLSAIDGIKNEKFVCSRIKRGDELVVPHPETVLQEGDVVHLVGPKDVLEEAANHLGEITSSVFTTSTRGTNKVVQRIVVTNRDVIGRPIGDLHLEERFDIVSSRLLRAGVQFIPSHDMKLQFGDYLNVIGTQENITAAAKIIGNSSVELHKVAMLPLFIGLILGILLGSIPIPVSGVPAPMKLGIAGGPLVMAILLARFGAPLTGNRIRWSMPAAGLSALREIGITLFLSIVGICAGANGFWQTLTAGPGLTWVWCGLFVTFIPLFVVGFLAYKFSKVNYLVLCGMIAGSQTDPPALAFANGLYSNPEASSLGYATVYPVTMFLRILSPQVMIIIAVLVAGV